MLDLKRLVLEDFRKITNSGLWKSSFNSFIENSFTSAESQDHFGTHWIESGHHIRDQIADDYNLVILLRHILPKYESGSITLYRGENLDRFQNNIIGFAWTPSIGTARMFASGLNSVKSGGVLLSGHFEPEAIISGPNRHSNWLGEVQFTVDPFSISQIQLLELFSPA